MKKTYYITGLNHWNKHLYEYERDTIVVKNLHRKFERLFWD